MIYTLISIICVLLILSIILFLRGIGLVKRNEKLEDVVIEYDIREEETKRVLELMLQQMIIEIMLKLIIILRAH